MLLKSLIFSENRYAQLSSKLDFEWKVLIIGAGAAGIFAAYTLQLAGIDFTLLEASDKPGGRLGKIEGFADFPLDHGAEWVTWQKIYHREVD